MGVTAGAQQSRSRGQPLCKTTNLVSSSRTPNTGTLQRGMYPLMHAHGTTRIMRQPGEPIYSFAQEYKLAAGNYNQVSRTFLTEQNSVHFIINSLNLTGYPLLDLRQKLVDLEDRGSSMSDILLAISKFPEFSALTKTEKLMSSQTTTNKAAGSRTFMKNIPGSAGDALCRNSKTTTLRVILLAITTTPMPFCAHSRRIKRLYCSQRAQA
jgi:hypothetical protein